MLLEYVYRARTATNQLVTGKVQAASLEAARKILLQNHLSPLSIAVPKGWTDYLPFVNKVSLKDRTVFARQLSTMIEAGLTLSQALRLMVKQTKPGRFQGIMLATLNDIQDGFSFSTALAKFPEVFDSIFINAVRSGEATGKLEAVLEQVATNMEKEVALRGKLKGALFYPAFVLLAMLGVGLVMTTQVIPQLKDVFVSSGQKLPSSTQLLLSLSDILIHQWYFLLLGAVGILFGLRMFFKSEFGTRFWSTYSLKIPVVGNIMVETSMARFGRLVGMLLGSGVPLLEALKLINDSFGNRLYQRAMAEIAAQVERGVPMSVPIADNPAFPLMVGQMVSVGEQTGKMDEVMLRLAVYYEGEVDSKVSGLTSLLEPMVIILLGVGVAWLVQAILLPVYQISTAVN